MSKELYLEAIEALRQRVAAAGEEEVEAIVLTALLELAGPKLVVAYQDFHFVPGGPGPTNEGWQVIEVTAERRRFFAAESAEEPPADAWGWVAAGSDDTFWEDDDEEGDEWEDDDPDRADEYGDEDDDQVDLLEDEKWEEADRRYDEDRLAELERLRDDEEDDDDQ